MVSRLQIGRVLLVALLATSLLGNNIGYSQDKEKAGPVEEDKSRPVEITGEIVELNLNEGIPKAVPRIIIAIKAIKGDGTAVFFELSGKSLGELFKLKGTKVIITGVILPIDYTTKLAYRGKTLEMIDVRGYYILPEDKENKENK